MNLDMKEQLHSNNICLRLFKYSGIFKSQNPPCMVVEILSIDLAKKI